MRATAAAERKKRKESLDGGRTPSLCPRHHRRGTATMTPGISGEEAATVHRRGWEAVEHRAKAGRMRRITLPDGVGHLTNGAAWWGPLKPAVFLRERGDQGESSVFPLPPSPLSPPLSAVSVSHPLEGFSHLAPVEPRALFSLTFRARWRTRRRTTPIHRRRQKHYYHCEGGDPRMPPRVAVEKRAATRANLREPEEDAKRTALFAVRKTTPTSSPS